MMSLMSHILAISILVLGLVVDFCSSVGSSEENSSNVLEEIIEKMFAEQHPLSQKELVELAELANSLDDGELVELGTRLCKKKKFETSMFFYDEAIRRNSLIQSHYRMRGKCMAEMGKLNEAISDYEHLIQMSSRKRKDDQVELSQMLFDAERYDEAITYTVDLGSIPLMNLSLVFASMGKLDEAIRCLTEAINLNPGNAIYFQKRGIWNAQLKKFPEAISDLRRATELASVHIRVPMQIDLCEILVDAKKLSEAQEELDTLKGKERLFLTYPDKIRIEKIEEKMKAMEGIEGRFYFPTARSKKVIEEDEEDEEDKEEIQDEKEKD